MTDYWSLTSTALHGEPWRLWTGHIVHYGPSHFFPDSIALVPPLLLLAPKHRLRTIVWGLALAPLISLAILAAVPGVEYRGSSALAVTIWVLAPLLYFNRHPYSDQRVQSAPAYVLLTFCTLKLILETFTSFRLGFTDVPPLPLAHWLGAIAGVMTFIFLRAKLVHTAIREHSASRLALSQRG
jgi:membrane associated rhomboid family serine protease